MSRSAEPHSRITRTVVVRGRRTSIRMEGIFWQLIENICTAERVSVADLLSDVDARRGPLNLTAAARVLAVTYFKENTPPRRLPAKG